jgi:GDP-mannose pyrophosphatase NudK
MLRSGEIKDGKAVILLQYLQTTGLMSGLSNGSLMSFG